MSETDTDGRASRDGAETRQVTINPLVLHRSQLPFTISLAAFVALLILIFTPTLFSLATGKPANFSISISGEGTTPFILLLALYLPHRLCCSSPRS